MRRLRAPAVVLLALLIAFGLVKWAPRAKDERPHPAVLTAAAQRGPSALTHSGYAELAAIKRSTEVYRRPAQGPFEPISATRPITHEQTVLPVLTTVHGASGAWLEVRLPGRPNGLTGWLQQGAAKLEATPWNLVVNLARRRVYAYDAGRLVRSFSAVIGAPATPTPRGHFFVEENVALGANVAGAPDALALSARSDVLQEFDGGPGQIALHGIENLGGTLGQAQSHGCVRLATPAIVWLAHHIAPGVPVTVG